jgi:hypothetical protein
MVKPMGCDGLSGAECGLAEGRADGICRLPGPVQELRRKRRRLGQSVRVVCSSCGTGWGTGMPSNTRNGRRTMAPMPPRVGA